MAKVKGFLFSSGIIFLLQLWWLVVENSNKKIVNPQHTLHRQKSKLYRKYKRPENMPHYIVKFSFWIFV